ncbi:MAG: 2-ketoisovalerate ferredoxin oxidoreductase [Bacteriovoracaceae bacterium]|jgi:2-oxoisovalerate ferredoxin oxidoreductase beta subunit|nr:2-ketoisovalerate ferredoxin oxidoreductase [Bacteriovoracaceae bacterium]
MGKILKRPKGFFETFDRKPGTDQRVTHYCPGCGHGRVHKLLAEAMEELEVIDRSIFISPVGCSVFGFYYFNCGNIQAAHGRAPAVATAASRSNPDSIVICYQGDGDLAAIGTAEILHAANRGENMTVIFVNNAIYGMTGGQMAPTTLEGQITATTPLGRDLANEGYPMRMAEIISQLHAPVYVAREAVSDVKSVMKAKRSIRKAMQSQKDHKGFSFVEILATCPTGWKLDPIESIQYIEKEMKEQFPIKVFKDVISEREPKAKHYPSTKKEDIFAAVNLVENVDLFPRDQEFIDNFSEQRFRIAGFGGQGVLMAGTTLAYLAMEHGLETTWLPSYGPEMRGGTANCHVILSNKKIGAPMVETPNVLIALNLPSYDQFEPLLESGGLILVNSSIIERENKRDDVTTLRIPMNEIAESCGVRAAANMAALSAYLTYSKLMKIDRLVTLIKHNFKKRDLIDKNIAVIEKASEYVTKHYL